MSKFRFQLNSGPMHHQDDPFAITSLSAASDPLAGDSVSTVHPNPRPVSARLGILIEDPVSRRLIDGIASQLELTPVVLSEGILTRAELADFELLLADEAAARRIRMLFSEPHDLNTGALPALVAVRPQSSAADQPPRERETVFDGMLTLPEQPAVVLAQLSIILYAHRAYVHRFRSTVDELQLNRRIFRSVTSSITISRTTDPDMPLIYVNPAFEVMTGYRAEEVLGRNCRFLQGDDTDQPGIALIRQAVKERRNVTVVIRNYRRDGSLFWNELAISPIGTRDNEITHLVGIQNDVTTRVEYEATLRESEKLATAGRLAASIAHEINNPLEAVTNLLYLARTTDDHGETVDYVLQAEKELQRVAQLTSQSLKFYRQSTAPTAVRPAELVGSILDLYRGRLEAANIQVHSRNRSCEPILCLESEIRQVLSNLIRNAGDAMRGASGRLVIRTRQATDWQTGAHGALFTVADTGSGMSLETGRRMYEAFYTTKGIHGTGLGLWVSEEIVARHQGRLRVRSRQTPPSGTVFSLFLPTRATGLRRT